MTFSGGILSLAVTLVQEAGVILGAGAVTVTLVGHLLSLHSRIPESTRGYVRAAHGLRALSLALIVLSGGVAVFIHAQAGAYDILLAPAFVFKWILIALLCALHFADWHTHGLWQDALEGFEGANWYALLIVHTIAPVVGWALLGEIYAGWLVAFAIVWAVFVTWMRGLSTVAATTPALQEAQN